MISSLSLARALGLQRTAFSKKLAAYNRLNPDAKIKPDEMRKGKRGAPAYQWSEERISDIAKALGCTLEAIGVPHE